MTEERALDPGTVLRVTGEVVRRQIAGETVLVPVRGRAADLRRIYALSPTAAFAWERFDGVRDLGQILAELLEEFDADEATAGADLEAFAAEALAEGLLEKVP